MNTNYGNQELKKGNYLLPGSLDRSKALAGQKMTEHGIHALDPTKPVNVLAFIFQGILNERKPDGSRADSRAVFLDCDTGSLVWIFANSGVFRKYVDYVGLDVGHHFLFIWTRDYHPILGTCWDFSFKKVVGGSFSVKKT